MRQDTTTSCIAARERRRGPRLLLTTELVDCILLDMLMPGMSGEELCRRIKASPAWRAIPVIMLTGREDREAILESFKPGPTTTSPSRATSSCSARGSRPSFAGDTLNRRRTGYKSNSTGASWRWPRQGVGRGGARGRGRPAGGESVRRAGDGRGRGGEPCQRPFPRRAQPRAAHPADARPGRGLPSHG